MDSGPEVVPVAEDLISDHVPGVDLGHLDEGGAHIDVVAEVNEVLSDVVEASIVIASLAANELGDGHHAFGGVLSVAGNAHAFH